MAPGALWPESISLYRVLLSMEIFITPPETAESPSISCTPVKKLEIEDFLLSDLPTEDEAMAMARAQDPAGRRDLLAAKPLRTNGQLW